MKTISREIFNKSKKYLQQNCRPLEIARFDYLFENGNPNIVIKELQKFQNIDGGFGKNLYAEFLQPDSTPLATSYALQLINEIDNIDEDIIKKTITYLEESYDINRHGWYSMDEKVNNFPHAVWWHWDQIKKMNPIDEHWGNPSAEIIGYLFKYRKYLTTLDINKVVDFAIDYWVNKTEFGSEHETYCYIQLYKYIDEYRKKLLSPNLVKATQIQVKTDVESWKKYTPQPLHFASNPNFFLFDVVKENIDNNLDFLIDTMTTDGTWFPHWNWYQYEEEWEKAKIIWVGILTIENLKKLEAYNRIK
jgi:hypothetical protein